MSWRERRNRWLRKPRFVSESLAFVEVSMFQWGLKEGDEHYTLSILGIINGPLPRYFKRVLIVEDKTGHLRIVRRWWD